MAYRKRSFKKGRRPMRRMFKGKKKGRGKRLKYYTVSRGGTRL